MNSPTRRPLTVCLALAGAASAAGFTPTRLRKAFSWTRANGSVYRAERTVVMLSPKHGCPLQFLDSSAAIEFCRGVIYGREHKP